MPRALEHGKRNCVNDLRDICDRVTLFNVIAKTGVVDVVPSVGDSSAELNPWQITTDGHALLKGVVEVTAL